MTYNKFKVISSHLKCAITLTYNQLTYNGSLDFSKLMVIIAVSEHTNQCMFSKLMLIFCH